ncbi:MAG: hypothetical protein ACLT4C_00730 [Butyricicoccus sp.]
MKEFVFLCIILITRHDPRAVRSSRSGRSRDVQEFGNPSSLHRMGLSLASA